MQILGTKGKNTFWVSVKINWGLEGKNTFLEEQLVW